MKKESLLGLRCYGDFKFSLHGIATKIYKEDETWKVDIVDPEDGDKETLAIEEVIFEVPYINQWKFEYLNSNYDIDGDEKFNNSTLWLDAKISEEQAIEIISKIYGCKYGNFSLRNLQVVDTHNREFKLGSSKTNIIV